MRNPAPVILSLLLAAAALFLILRKPETPQEKATDPPPPVAEAVDAPPAETGEDSDPVAASATSTTWPQDKSDIPADPKAVFGSLDNGMRYIILPNAEPPKRLSLRLHIAAGSLMEAEDQRGVAHFLEHMVFNGSKNFTPAELIPRMQRLGIAFGAHVNAYTSFDETVYMLDLPEQTEDTMKLGFTVMRDFSDGALLKEEEIDNERGVILSEKTSRDSVGYRMMQKQFSQLLPDSLLEKRFPIGTEEVIKTAPRERFVDFYERYYTPSRMTFIAVGDMDPAVIETKIRETFSSLRNPENPGSDPDMGSVTSVEGLKPAIFADKEATGTELGLLSVDTHTPRIDSKETRISRMPLSVANSILGLRFDRLAKTEGSPILGGSASKQDIFNFVELGSIDLNVADDRWEESVPVLEQEFRRAMEYGFTSAELTEAKANLLNAYQQAVKSKDTRPSNSLATAIAGSINDGRVLTTPETDLAIVEAGLETLSAEDCHKAFVDFWEGRGMHLILTTKVAPSDAEETLAKLYQESTTQPVDPPKKEVLASFAYTEFGEPGTIESKEEITDLGITQLKLSNGVTVNLKPTDFEKNRISISTRIGSGRLTMPPNKVGLAEFAGAVIEGGGIGEHTVDDLQRIFAGKNIGFGFAVGDDAFGLSGQTTPEDFDLQMAAMTAQILHPGYHPEAITQFRKQIPMLYQQLKHTSAGSMQEMSAWLRGDDPRFSFPKTADTFLSYTVDDIQPWIEESFTKADIELSIVGDFKSEEILPSILRTFGAIDKRPAPEELPAEVRKVAFPESPQSKSFSYESKIAQGRAILIWKTEGIRHNHEHFRRLNLLGDILGDRLREEIREKLGASYSPQAGVNGSTALDDFGFMLTLSEGKPDDIEKLVEVSESLAATLAKEGATEDELDRARKPALADIDKNLRDNGYWLSNVLSGSQQEPHKLELARNRKSDVESITLEEINDLAAKYLTPDNAIKVTIKSEEGVQTAE
ncbi:M16 family metallopeptidase [Haloferula chungangensis]|uniref:M16 family metallopeptidase n=1 Tax=Haloferula chungangensis TaxID=1048331 RepID=A0ABW2L077_9BACT